MLCFANWQPLYGKMLASENQKQRSPMDLELATYVVKEWAPYDQSLVHSAAKNVQGPYSVAK